MFLDQPTAWTAAHWPVLAVAGVLLAVLTGLAAYIAHRTSGPVLAAGIGALVCTGFSADTSWRFAGHELNMDTTERAWLFAAGEIVLIVCAVMARANKRATATADSAGTPGVPGVLVWCIAVVQVIPAFVESGLVGGLVRAVFGPVMSATLWHLAMGLDIRVTRPEALSSGLPAQIGHELRERLLSHLGLATRNRTAEEISRDRAHARAVRLASRRWIGPWGRARLAAAVARSRATADGTRRHRLLQDLAGRRTAGELRTMDVPSPWVLAPEEEPHPATPLGVAGAALRRMHPMDAIQAVHEAHGTATPAELAALTTEYGVPVTEGLVRIALHPKAAQPDAPKDAQPQPILAPQPQPVPALGPAAQPEAEESDFEDTAASALALTQPDADHQPADAAASPDADAAAHPEPGNVLVLELAPMSPPQPEVRQGQPYIPAAAQPDAQPQPQPSQATPRTRPARQRRPVSELRSPDEDAQLLKRAKPINLHSLGEDGKKASLRRLQSELGIGQRRAQRIQALLPDTLTAAFEDTQPQPQPSAKEA
ncbi:hypothetical protein [Streptomyces sp. CRN 30]|uniref:hypothetical protein n=1 Tax=Streptomyces sp. CRN 30 TaxID=3075613 RepID=UPI002A8335F4|nr:hypothetical protein [Streptomyces sp. CRN 30]